MLNRRKFIQRSALSSLLATIGLGSNSCSSKNTINQVQNEATKPSVIATWKNVEANRIAFLIKFRKKTD